MAVQRKVLIISPHFPPINAPDHQRVRMSLHLFRQFGWLPYVLTVHPRYVEGVHEPLLELSVPESVEVVRTRALPVEYTGRVGLRALALRCLPFLYRAGARIIREEKIDLVYFSTTAFPVMSLGRIWQRRYQVPYVLDFQDPWLSDYYDTRAGANPPGGLLKYTSSQFLARLLEPYSLRKASHTISASPSYPQVLLNRYPWLTADQFTVLPFGATETDFQLVRDKHIRQSIFDPKDGNRHWVYVGRGGADMAFALRALFHALGKVRREEAERFKNVRLHFIGTDYAPGKRARKTVEPVAAECGVADVVSEHPHRIPYFEALRCLLDAEALLVTGSDDPSYTASKMYPYILARKPLLAIFHAESSVVALLHLTKAGEIVTFRNGDTIDNIADTIYDVWFRDHSPRTPITDWAAFDPFTATEMTRQQCEIFNQCIASK